MEVFLKIVGVVALVLALVIIAFGGFIWWHWRRIKKALASSQLPPSSIDLTEDPAPAWLQQDQAAREIAELETLGFTRAGTYSVVGIPGVQVLGLCHPQSGAFGCYYRHQSAGLFVDLCAQFSDGLELTVTNAPMGGEMDTRPGTEKLFLSGRPIAELHAALTTRIAGKTLRTVAAAGFKAEFIAAYARDMKWRSDKQGISETEVRRVAARDGKTYTEKQLQDAFEETKLQELRQWSEEAVTEFAKRTTLRVSAWKEFENRMVLFRDNLHAPAYLRYLGETAELTEAQVSAYRSQLAEGMQLGQLLDQITADTGQKFIRLGEVESPAKFTIFGVTPIPGNESE